MNTVIRMAAGSAPLSGDQALHALREDFDRAFTRGAVDDSGELENFLVLKIAGDAYALRVAQISGLYTNRSITSLPSPLPELIGLAGFRAQATPVYDLASLLGYPRVAAPKWMAVLRHQVPLAIAFEEFHLHLSVTPEQITASSLNAAHKRTASFHLLDAIQENGNIFPIIELDSVLTDIQQRVAATRSLKER